jgi:hypothetical protein
VKGDESGDALGVLADLLRMDGSGVLSDVVESRELPTAMTLEGTFAGVLSAMTEQSVDVDGREGSRGEKGTYRT